MIGFFKELKKTLSSLKETVSSLAVWKLEVNITLQQQQEEIKELKAQLKQRKAKREFLSEDDYEKLINAFSERNYARIASWLDLSKVAARLSQDNLKEISSSLDLDTLCIDHLLPRVVESALTNAAYQRLLKEASLTSKKLVLTELTQNLIWDNKQEVFDNAAKEIASEQFLRGHYSDLVKALAQELKNDVYLVPLAKVMAKQPEFSIRAANYLATRIHHSLSSDASSTVVAVTPDNTTTFMD
jgi:hypothetical protein